jgi:tetratricopeptide (TPR) repeat protein
MAKSPDPNKKPTPPNDPHPSGEEQPILDDEELFAELVSDDEPIFEQTPGDQASEVDLGRPSGGKPPKAPSGQSSTIWADLVKDPSSGGDAGAIDFDAPSDADVVKNALGEKVEAMASDPDLFAQSVVPPGAESSRVDLFDPPPQDDPLHSRNYPPPSESEDISGLSGSTPRQPAESDINLGPDLPIGTPVPVGKHTPASMRRDSQLDFGAPIGGEGELPSSRRLESGIDLGLSALAKEEPPPRIESGIDLGSAAVIDMDEAEEAKPVESKPVESGIDIGSAAVVDASEEEDIAGAMPLDSGVDLGAAIASDEEMEGAIPLDSSSGIVVEGAAVVDEEADAAAFVFPPPTGEKIAQPSSDSDIIIGADDLAALAGPSESSVNLDANGEKGSSRDLIAEAVESGVDLTGADEGAVDEEAIVLTGAEGEPGSSSAVDLGASVVTIEDEPAAVADLSPSGAAVLDDEELAGASLVDEEDGNVELGGTAVLEDDSAEGTLEDMDEEAAVPSEAEVDDFLSTVTDEAKETAVDGEAGEDGLGTEAGEAPAIFGEGDEEAVAEEAVESGEEEEEYHPPPPRPKYGRRWVGGTLVGMTLAAAAAAALITFDEGLTKQLGDQMRGLIGYESETAAGPGPGKPGGKQRSGGGTQTAKIWDRVKTADFSEEEPAIDTGKGEEVVSRGEYFWKKYLSTSPKDLKKDAPLVKKALDDLAEGPKKPLEGDDKKKAEVKADALYWQGHIEEMTGNLPQARKLYTDGAQNLFPGHADLQQRFKDAIDRLDVLELTQPARGPAPMGAGARAPAPIEYYGVGIDFLAGQAQPATPPEAGPDFWRALKAALNLQFDGDTGALKLIDKAIDNHKARRLTQIGKPQNPLSDPTEEIFVKAAEQLRVFWLLQQRLQKDDYLPKKPDASNVGNAPKALDALFADLAKVKGDLAKAEKDLTTLKADYAKLDDAKKKADMQVVTVTTERDKEKQDKETALANLATERKNLDAEKEKVAAGILIIARLEKDKQSLGETIIGTGEKVGLRDIDPVRSKSILYQRLDDLVEVARKVDPDNRLAMSIVEIRNLKTALKERWTPETMLGIWTPLMADRTQKELAASALEDVGRVKANAGAPLAVRSQAFAVEGLALRNQGEFGKARTALGEAVRGDVAGPGWKPLANEVLKELTNLEASYIPRADSLRQRRRYDEAVAVLDEGMKAFPDKVPELQAQRSQVRLDRAHEGVARLLEDTPGIKEAREDAQAAIKAGKDRGDKGLEGAGTFAEARVAEELADWQRAEQLYREAVKLLPEDHLDASKAQLAIARLLLRGIEPKPVPQPMPKDARRPGIKGQRFGFFRLPDIAELVMGDLPSPEEEAKIKEAIELADKVLARKDIDQFPLLKAQALAVKGLWTQALNAYVQGLKPHLSREHYEGLKSLIENHPLQRRPDVARIEHPMQGEKHYAQGLAKFYAREFASAEKEFLKAIENFEHDARYHYFLGLSRLAQGKLSASEDFERGARLEIDNRPGPGAVNAALERIQGCPRQLINEARERAR